MRRAKSSTPAAVSVQPVTALPGVLNKRTRELTTSQPDLKYGLGRVPWCVHRGVRGSNGAMLLTAGDVRKLALVWILKTFSDNARQSIASTGTLTVRVDFSREISRF